MRTRRGTVFLALALFLALAGRAAALDLDILAKFGIGAQVAVIPAKNDRSRSLGLVFIPEIVRTDYMNTLSISGMVVNNSNTCYEAVTVDVKVWSLKGDQISYAKFSVDPPILTPGAAGNFTRHISLFGNRPRFVRYAVEARRQ